MLRSDGWDLVLVLILDSDLPHLPLMRQFSLIVYYTYLQLQRHYSKDEANENLPGYVELVYSETPVTYQSDSKLVTPLSSVRVVIDSDVVFFFETIVEE